MDNINNENIGTNTLPLLFIHSLFFLIDIIPLSLFILKMKFGKYLTENNIITKDDLTEALAMQVDNADLKLGEVLVGQEVLTRSELIQHIEAFIESTGTDVKEVTSWVSQDEADELIQQLKDSL